MLKNVLLFGETVCNYYTKVGVYRSNLGGFRSFFFIACFFFSRNRFSMARRGFFVFFRFFLG